MQITTFQLNPSRRRKAGLIAELKPGSRIVPHPQIPGYLIAHPGDPVKFLHLDGTLEILEVSGETVVLPRAELDHTSPDDSMPGSGQLEIIDLDKLEAETAPSKGEVVLPPPAEMLKQERVNLSDSSWLDFTILDGQVLTIVEARTVYAFDKAIPAEVHEVTPGSRVAKWMQAVKKKLGITK